MPDFIVLMHADLPDGATPDRPEDWERHVGDLMAADAFRGGSAIGEGLALRGDALPVPATTRINGYVLLSATDFEQATRLCADNPVLRAGGTIEIRQLVETG